MTYEDSLKTRKPMDNPRAGLVPLEESERDSLVEVIKESRHHDCTWHRTQRKGASYCEMCETLARLDGLA